MFSFVVAMDQNRLIGKDNRLIWSLPKDLQRFKEITLTESQTMIMGRKTFESLPFVLPGRRHLVLTKNRNYEVAHEQVEVIHDFSTLLPLADTKEEYFVIGGGEIFTLFLPYTKKMYLTLLQESFEGHTYFPFYEEEEWKVIAREEGIIDEKNPHPHLFVTLEKK